MAPAFPTKPRNFALKGELCFFQIGENEMRFALIFVVAIGLAGCHDDDTSYFQRDKDNRETGLVVFTDGVTGCQYVRTAWHDGIYPRLDAAGLPMCKGLN